MAYKYSNLDKNNTKWFANDNSRASLVSIELRKGKIRGLTPFKINFEYPITAVAGTNGSGKSTLLALSSCAFHNDTSGFCPPLRRQPYYTFKDFFVQSSEETPVEGVEIYYGIKHDNWRGKLKSKVGYQKRVKRKRGKWNDYHRRVNRNVIYFGVQRVVPHYERSVHISYRQKFKPGSLPESDRTRIAKLAGRIIGKSYTDFDSYEHSKYSLPNVTSSGFSYSGFNMGAGESAVFEILTTLFRSGPGTLLVIDEIELGLHEMAQIRLIEALKKLCKEFKCQVICSTHSHAILRSLPPEGRYFVETVGDASFFTQGVSADFACGKMGRPDSYELDIFVEDSIGRDILLGALPIEVRRRSRIIPIGSHSAVVRQIACRYLENIDNCMCILDGDQSNHKSDALKLLEQSCEASTDSEKEALRNWGNDRLQYLPGTDWPEKWLIESAIEAVSRDTFTDHPSILADWGLTSAEQFVDLLQQAQSAEKHSEFYELAEGAELEITKVRNDVISLVVAANSERFEEIVSAVSSRLP